MQKVILRSMLPIIFLATFAMAGTASAFPVFDDVIVEYWAGTGSNEALLIIDFDENSTADSFAFGYRWDSGTKTGEDMIKAVDLAGALNVTDTGGTGAGYFLDYIEYLGNERGNSSTSEFWAYWVEDGDPFNSWDKSDIGSGSRTLSDNSWDGWSIPFGDAPDYAPPPSPDIPAVPIPAAVWLLGSGLVGLFGLRRRKAGR